MEKEFVESSSQNAHQGDDIKNRSTFDNNLHPHNNHYPFGPGSPSSLNLTKKESSASLEFGKGERRSPLPERNNMLKHATTGSSKQGTTTGQVVPAPGQSVPSTTTTTASEPEAESTDSNIKLPQRFVVKYLGFRETSNLWGIRYTRRPVDEMVSEAKKVLTTNPEKALALVKMEVTEEGILVGAMPQNTNANFPQGKFAIESISYGVQDLVYTRVFAMIVVKTDGGKAGIKLSQLVNQSSNGSSGEGGALPFRCHAFVCDSRQTARRLTYSLASAFETFSKKVASGKITAPTPKKFAIDLRSSDEIEAELADSEA